MLFLLLSGSKTIHHTCMSPLLYIPKHYSVHLLFLAWGKYELWLASSDLKTVSKDPCRSCSHTSGASVHILWERHMISPHPDYLTHRSLLWPRNCLQTHISFLFRHFWAYCQWILCMVHIVWRYWAFLPCALQAEMCLLTNTQLWVSRSLSMVSFIY